MLDPAKLRTIATQLRNDPTADHDTTGVVTAIADIIDAAASEDLREFGDARSILAAVDRLAQIIDDGLNEDGDVG